MLKLPGQSRTRMEKKSQKQITIFTQIDIDLSTHGSDSQLSGICCKLVERMEKEKDTCDKLEEKIQTLTSHIKSIIDIPLHSPFKFFNYHLLIYHQEE